MIQIQEKNQSDHVLVSVAAVAVAVQVTQVLIITSHQNLHLSNILQTNIPRKNHLYHVGVPRVVHPVLGLDQFLLVLMNDPGGNGCPQVRNQVLGVSINPANANVRLEDIGVAVAVVAVVDHHHVILRRAAIAQVVLVLLVVHRAVIILEVLVLVMTLAVLRLAIVQSLDLHPFLGDGDRLVFWIEDESQGKFQC